MKLLVPDNFRIPQSLRDQKFVLLPLTVNWVIKDYDAVMSSLKHLQSNFPFGPDHHWPSSHLTLEQDLIDLGWHQKEFQIRHSFAYTVLSPHRQQCLGCIYIFPSTNPQFDTQIITWVRQSEAKHLDQYLFRTVQKWIKNKWPFKHPGYPGRTIPWKAWGTAF